MKTSLLMLGLLLLGIGIAVVTAYIDGILTDKCNSNNIDLYIKILLALSASCIVFSVSYFICRLSCGKDMDLFDINGRVYLFVMALLCITTAVISGLLHTELNNNSCDFNNTYTIVLISTTSVLFAICLGLFIASFYYFRHVSLSEIENLNLKKAKDIEAAEAKKKSDIAAKNAANAAGVAKAAKADADVAAAAAQGAPAPGAQWAAPAGGAVFPFGGGLLPRT
jgi:hypothetical protein